MHNIWFNALRTLSILFFIFLINTTYLAQADENSSERDDDGADNFQIQEPEETRMAKRAWHQFKGSWGKRNIEDEHKQIPLGQSDYYLDKSIDYEPSRLQSPIDYYNLRSDSDDFDESPPLEKRSWKSMNGAWGKRDLGKFRGNSGKREPGNWNNLRGLWGKRSVDSRNWNKLSSAWGRK